MIKNIILTTLMLSLLLLGCQKVEEPKITPKETSPDISIDSDISGVDPIDKDLNPEELNKLESELDEINW